jgi:uncharacterized membrane protein
VRRREYLDWLRGLAVLLMIAAHLLDSWTAEPDRRSSIYGVILFIAGLGSPLFLFLAGVSVGLSAGSKLRRLGNAAAAATAVARRGVEIFGLAFLFRLQSWILGWSSNPNDLLKVDILNIMGPSIVLAAFLWRTVRTSRARFLLLLIAGTAMALLTPVIRTLSFGILPDPVRAYFVPVPGLSSFIFFPWTAFVMVGTCIGVLIDGATADRERRLNAGLGAMGSLVAAVAYAASYLPSAFANSSFWTTSPAYFFLRAGIVTVGIGAAYAWTSRYVTEGRWSPVIQLGRTSLFIYWIHVELVYGLISRPLHHTLTLAQASIAYVSFTLLMLLCSMAKDRVVTWHRSRGTEGAKAARLRSVATGPRRSRPAGE